MKTNLSREHRRILEATAGQAGAAAETGFRRFIPHFSFRKSRTCVGERLKPVSVLIASTASLIEAGGWARREAAIVS